MKFLKAIGMVSNGKRANLQYGLVRNGILAVTDLDRRLEVKVGQVKDGLYHLPLLVSSGDFEAAKIPAPASMEDEFPVWRERKETDLVYHLPCELFGEKALGVAPAVACADDARAALCYIHFNAVDGIAEGCNGHILLQQKLGISFSRSFLIKPEDLRLVIELCAIEAPHRVSIIDDIERSESGKQTTKGRFLCFTAPTWSLRVNTSFEDYPNTNTKVVIPRDITQGVVWSEGQTHLALKAIKMLRPYLPKRSKRWNAKPQLVGFDERGLFSINNDIAINKRWNTDRVICRLPENVKFKIVNAVFLEHLLKFMGELVFYAGRTDLDGIVAINATKGRFGIVMPVRLVNEIPHAFSELKP